MNTTDRHTRMSAIYQDTSRAAWDSFLDYAAVIDRKILDCIVAEDGTTCDEIELQTGLRHQTASAQIRHMVEAGLLVDSGRRLSTRSGRSAIIWNFPPVLANAA